MGIIFIQEPNRAVIRKTATTPPTLEELQGLLGGYAELVQQGLTTKGEYVQFYANEDGLSLELTPNPEAMLLFRTLFGHDWHSILVGPVVAVVGPDVQVP